MAGEAYRANAPVTLGQLAEGLLAGKQWAKDYFEDNVDSFSIMAEIKSVLTNVAHKSTSSMSTKQVADYLEQYTIQIYLILQQAGVLVDSLRFDQIPMAIQSIAQLTGCFILDDDNTKWTAAQWGAQPVHTSQVVGVLLNNNEHPFLIARRAFTSNKFGMYSHTVLTQQGWGGAGISTPYSGLVNCLRILQVTNPGRLKNTQYGIDYHSGLTKNEVYGKYVVFFSSYEELTTWANGIGLAGMVELGGGIAYVYPHATTANAYVVRNFNGSTSITFATKEAVAPYTDQYGIIGCGPLELCWDYKPFTGDEHQWRIPSIYEVFMQCLNRTSINECLRAIGESDLSTGDMWTCQQSGAPYEYSVNVGSGSISNNGKNNTYGIRAVSDYVA